MKAARIIFAWMFLLVFCAGCSGAEVVKPTIDYPPYCAEFLKVAGKDLNDVIPALGLTTEDFMDETETGGWYVYGKPVEYLGCTFEMRLDTTVADNGLRYVHRIVYLLWDENPETGAQTVTDLRDQLLKEYGAAYNPPKYSSGNYGQEETKAPSPLNTLNKAELLGKFTEGNGYSAGIEWLLSTDIGQLPQESLNLWVKPPTCITAQLRAGYPVQEDEKTVVFTQLEFGLSYSYRNSSDA